MKKYLLFSIGLLFFNTMLHAQIDEKRKFVYLYSDSVIYGDTVMRFYFPFSSYYLVDFDRYEFNRVKFANEKNGFWANTRKLDKNPMATGLSASNNFALRTTKGKINVYERTVKTSGMSGTQFYYSGETKYSYYNKGYEDLKKVNYDNLVLDVKDNVASMDFLNKYKKTRKAQTILFVTGGGLILTGLLVLYENATSDENNIDYLPTLVCAGSGIASIGIATLLSRGQPHKLKSAIYMYNLR